MGDSGRESFGKNDDNPVMFITLTRAIIPTARTATIIPINAPNDRPDPRTDVTELNVSSSGFGGGVMLIGIDGGGVKSVAALMSFEMSIEDTGTAEYVDPAADEGALAVRETVLPEKLEEPPASVIVPDFKWHILFELLYVYPLQLGFLQHSVPHSVALATPVMVAKSPPLKRVLVFTVLDEHEPVPAAALSDISFLSPGSSVKSSHVNRRALTI